LKSTVTKNQVTPGVMREFVVALLNDEKKEKPLQQFRIKINPKTHQLTNEDLIKVYRNDTISKRILLKALSHCKTYPYGYTNL
jgi:lipopolysaccharide export system protein LptC